MFRTVLFASALLMIGTAAHAQNAKFNFDRLTEALVSSPMPGGCEIRVASRGEQDFRFLEVELSKGGIKETAVTPKIMVLSDDEDVIDVDQNSDGSVAYSYSRKFQEDTYPFSVPGLMRNYTHKIKVVISPDGRVTELRASTWGMLVDYDGITCKD